MARLAPDFLAEIQPLIEEPWSVAMLDFVFPQTRGKRPPDFATTLKFGAALNRLAAEDAAVHRLTAESPEPAEAAQRLQGSGAGSARDGGDAPIADRGRARE